MNDMGKRMMSAWRQLSVASTQNGTRAEGHHHIKCLPAWYAFTGHHQCRGFAVRLDLRARFYPRHFTASKSDAAVLMAQELPWCQLLPLLVTVLLLTVAPSAVADDNAGSTEHMKEIFIGRCYDYKQIRYKSVLPQVTASCEDLWDKFFTAFSYRAPCALAMDRYQPFIVAASQRMPQSKAMFWSGVKDLVHEYASEGERYITLEDTAIGYMVDSLVWCGQESAPGINYTRCPSWTDCPLEATEAFWASVSKAFARSVTGQVTAMMDVSHADRPAYRRDSFFGKYELPSLDKSLVSEVRVLLTHPLDTPGFENCENGSLALLEQDVTSLGFAFSCSDDPDAILHLLCVDNPEDRACRLASQYMFRGPSNYPDVNDNGHLPLINSKPLSRF